MGTPKFKRNEIKLLLQSRLRSCWWGPRADVNLKLKGTEVGNHDSGKGKCFRDVMTENEAQSISSISKKMK